jgi:uncharacterized protein with NAD-binding domain and iron-sulfur cluster
MKGVRVINHSRVYSITVYTSGDPLLLLPGFSYVGGDAVGIDCVDPDDPEAQISINDEACGVLLKPARTDAIVHDGPRGGLDLRCVGAKLGTKAELLEAVKAAKDELLNEPNTGGREGARAERPLKKFGDPVWVTVLGGGIAGLTAAHELAERGFFVQVVEKAHSTPSEAHAGGRARRRTRQELANETEEQRKEGKERLLRRQLVLGLRQPDVGGVARTQWVTPTVQGRALKETDQPWAPAPTRSVHGDVAWDPETARQQADGTNTSFDRENFYVPFEEKGPRFFSTHFKRWWRLLTIEDEVRNVAAIQLVAVIYQEGVEKVPAGLRHILGPKAAYERLRQLREEIFRVVSEASSSDDDNAKSVVACFADVDLLPAARIEVTLSADAIRELVANASREFTVFTGACMRRFEDVSLVAGEHGFRFFPGFYRHLRDTMKRTPLFDSASGDSGEHSVHDHLHEVEWQTVADPTRARPSSFARRNISSVGALVEQYQSLRKELGYRPSDLLRFALRMLRYATSSSKRRAATYEDLSWYDFLTLRELRGASTPLPLVDPAEKPERLHYGQRFESTIRHSPRALVAMDSLVTDARSQGNISLQLAMDQFDLHDATDSTLRAPTSDAWLVHWKTYLQRLGVRFFAGEVTDIQYEQSDDDDDKGFCKPTIVFATSETPVDFVSVDKLREFGINHYVVSAMDLVATERVCRALVENPADRAISVPDSLKPLVADAGPAVRDRGAALGRDPEDITKIAVDQGDRLQTLSGIQIYFRQRTSFVDGHIYYAESPWGLSAVSQVQYWRPFTGGRTFNGLLGNLSIDIGAWRAWTPSLAERKWLPQSDFWQNGVDSPNKLEPNAIADLVCLQVTSCARIDQNDWASPAFYHIDDNIEFEWQRKGKVPEKLPSKNRYPYLINVVGDWCERPPGEPWAPNDPGFRDERPGVGHTLLSGGEKTEIPVWSRFLGERPFGYRIHGNNLVFCGAWLRTFTRMGTMESANESARHAVNAILDHLAYLREKAPKADDTARAAAARAVAAGHLLGDLGGPKPWKLNLSSLNSGSAAMNHPGQAPVRRGTPYGDYCDIWDLERFEFPDLTFAKLIDEKIMERFGHEVHRRQKGEGDDVYVPPTAPKNPDNDFTGITSKGAPMPPPHIFDRLGVDRLPDLIEHDGEAISSLTLLDGLIAALRDASGSDAEAAARSIDAWRIKLDRFISDLHLKQVVK